ncbi:MAG: thermonuclease family protein [Acetobacteraceae bacterium]|nr:thermonuclease family protein [Acetobacteraceae bacterium]
MRRHRRVITLVLALISIAIGVLIELGAHRDWMPSTSAPRRAPPAGPAAVLQGRARVIDGDTIEVAGRRVRLHGIDAPERDQACERGGRSYACGEEATRALAQLLAGREVRCAGRGQDRYGRVLAVCRAGGADIGEAMVRAGWAVAFRRYAEDYASAEAAARRERLGLWAGRFDAPEDWRRRAAR